MEGFIRKIIRIRWVIIIGVLGLTLFFGFQIPSLTINSDILSTLPDDDPTASLYKNIGEQFGGNDIGMIVLETENVFNPNVLKNVKQITDSLRLNPGISTVTSLTNILDIKSSEWGIEIGKLIDEYDLPDTQKELDSLRKYIRSKEMYNGAIVSKDGTSTLVLFTLLPDANKQETAMQIKSKIAEMNISEKIYYAGLPFLLIDITELILSDMLWLIPVVFVVILLLLLFSFRSVRGMILPLLIAGLTVVWTLGIMAVSGLEITIISNIMPVVLLALGSAYTIHVINSIDLFAHKDRKKTLIKAMSYTMIPVVLASVTTATGFVSFVFGAYLSMIREFGIATAIGIIIALILSVFFVPAIISAFSTDKIAVQKERKVKEHIFSRAILLPLKKTLFEYPGRILITWGVLLIVSIGGIFQIKTSVNITEYFQEDNPTRVSENLMQEKFGGSMPVFIQFDGDLQDPELLKMMIRTEDFMKEDPHITSAQSVADLVKQMNDAMGEGQRIPDERAKIEQLWFLLDGQDIMQQLVSYDLDRGIIQSKFASIETNDIEAFTAKMNRFIEENSTDNYRISFTGIPPLYVNLNASLVKSQYSSLAIAIILVFLIVAIIMRSFSKGVYATVPIIATIIILLGFMGYTGIPLDIATVLVGSIALGIGIDYSIHMISSFNNHLNTFRNVEKAISESILKKGNAIIINFVSVAAGFLVLLLAKVIPVQNFGLLIAISMVFSGLGALTLLPVIIILMHKKKNMNQTKI